MSLSALGINTSEVEVTNISTHGIWLLVRDHEYFLPYAEFPWFRDQPVAAIIAVEEIRPGHFYWPELDIDLTEAMLEHPEDYPEIAQ